jgi:glucokinase
VANAPVHAGRAATDAGTVRPVTDRVATTAATAPPSSSAPSRYLAIDLGRSRLAAGVVDESGTVLVRDRVATPARHVWPTLVRLVHRVIAASPDDVRPSACGVTCVGPVDHRDGSMTTVHMPSWEGFPMRAELEQVTGLPVSIDSAGRGLALAEWWCGQAAGLTDFVALLLGDEVDAGIVANGRLLDGRTGNVGQVGHLVVEPGGRTCVCGGEGCLDAYASAAAIELDTNRPLRRAPPAIVERTGIMLARAIASVAAMVDSTKFLVAGLVPDAFGQPMFDVITRELEQRSRLSHLNSLTVVPIGRTSGGRLVAAAAVAHRAAGAWSAH